MNAKILPRVTVAILATMTGCSKVISLPAACNDGYAFQFYPVLSGDLMVGLGA